MRAMKSWLLLSSVTALACGGGGGGPVPASQADTTPPSAPGGLSVAAPSPSQISLTWTASTDDVAVTGYQVSRDGSPRATPASTSYEDTGLSPSTEYCYTVSARDAAGNASAQSAQRCAITPAFPTVPAAPTGVAASAGDGLVILQWDAVAGVTSYDVYLASAPGPTKATFGSLPGGTHLVGVSAPHALGGLTNDVTYYFVVTALDANWESVESSEVSATPRAMAPVTYRLDDTGIGASQCYQADGSLVACDGAGALALSSAQDGMLGRDAEPANNTGADGRLGFSFAAVAGGCVRDQVTGLMWEVKTADGGLRDEAATYTNYDSTTAAQRRGTGWDWLTPTQAEIDAPTNAVGFRDRVNAQGLCGYRDWRVPTVDELQSIVDYGGGGPAIDAAWFPHTRGATYWTATSIVDVVNTDYFGVHHDVDYAGAVSFEIGHVYAAGVNESVRDSMHAVRLVRAGPAVPAPRYTVSADGQEVTDALTTLTWRRCPEGATFAAGACDGAISLFLHDAALQRAASEASSTGLAWRLPDIKELSSLVDRRFFHPAIDPTLFPNTPLYTMWSGTPYLPDPRFLAWGVNFASGGDVYRYERVNGGSAVRLVRSAP
jgi:hypothetical protein